MTTPSWLTSPSTLTADPSWSACLRARPWTPVFRCASRLIVIARNRAQRMRVADAQARKQLNAELARDIGEVVDVLETVMTDLLRPEITS